MTDGTYARTWPTDTGVKTRCCVVRGKRFLQLSDARWRDIADVEDLPGVWTRLGDREPGSAARAVQTL